MPYSTPADPSSSSSPAASTSALAAVHPQQHRRHRSSFSDERGPGAHASLGSLPRRRPSASTPKRPLFHISVEDESPPEGDDIFSPEPPSNALSLDTGVVDTLDGVLAGPSSAPLLGQTNSLRLSMANGRFSPTMNRPSRIELPPKGHQPQGTVPFPTSSPLSPSVRESPFPSPSSSSSLPRTPSTPVILSNGKPLKSSLKSSSSSPNVAGDFAGRMGKHFRAQSAPSTPRVHFAEKDAGLESVKVFHRTGKPASLSKPPGDETETETEAESYPFPSVSSSTQILHEIDFSAGSTSPIPNPSPSPYANVHVETVTLPRTRPPTLRGTVLVRNLAFEKIVAVRFTMDDWQTTSEVICKHVVSLPGLPPPFPRARHHVGDLAAGIAAGERDEDETAGQPTWDRFSFTIRLEDYEAKLSERTLYLVARYLPCGTGGEFWDNNGGSNYRIGFRRAAASPLPSPSRTTFSTAYDLPPFATASQSLTDLLSSANASKGLPGLNAPTALAGQHSQQRTFSAPSSLKYTPITGALPAVVSRVAATSESIPETHRSAEKAVMLAVRGERVDGEGTDSEVERTPIERDVEALRSALPLVRRHSTPHPRRDTPHFPLPPPIAIPKSMSQSQPHSPPSPKAGPAGAYIARRLSLSNYVAPCVVHPVVGMATPPTTPPKEGQGLPNESEGERKSESESDTTPTLPPMIPQMLIGGHPATSIETLTIIRASGPAVSPISDDNSTSSSDSSAPSLDDPPLVTQPLVRTASLDDVEDRDNEDNTPFSPTGRKAPEFRMGSLDGQFGLRQLSQLASPPVSRQNSEDGSGQSSPAGGSSITNSPKQRTTASPPRRASPTRLDLPDLSAVFARDVERARASPSPPSPSTGFPSTFGDTDSPVQPLNEGKVDTSDSSYAAFVRQWCFAQSAPPTPGVMNAGSAAVSPAPTPSPPIGTPSMTSLGGVSALSGLGLGVGVAAGAVVGSGGNGNGNGNGNGVGPRRQMAWAAEHQVGVGSNTGLGSGYGFPGFGIGFATGRLGGAQPPTVVGLAEGMVGAQMR